MRITTRKLIIGLIGCAVFAAGIGASVLPASAEQRTLLVTLVTGQTLTVTVDVPPGTPIDQIKIPGITTPIASISEVPQPPAPPAPGNGGSGDPAPPPPHPRPAPAAAAIRPRPHPTRRPRPRPGRPPHRPRPARRSSPRRRRPVT